MNMIKLLIVVSLSSPFFVGANTTITNLNTVQQLQRNQMLLNEHGVNRSPNTNSGHSGPGYPVYDPSAILELKQKAYNEWKKEHHSEISYNEWETKELPNILNR